MGAERRRIVPVFITVDPARDTPQVLKSYVAAFGPDFIGLTGSGEAITAAEKAYKVYAAREPLAKGGYAMSHSSVIYLVGPDGKLVSFYDEAISPADLAKDLKAKT
jgi:protein SCO1/2